MIRLRYQQRGSRDLRLDWLRGYAVLVMSVNHFGLDRSLFRPFTGGAVFLINAAEVFFFVSGFTLGLISCRKPIEAAATRCYRRAGQICLSIVVLACGAALLGFSEMDSIWAYFRTTGSLREAPFWAAVLVTYVLNLLVVPIALHLLSAGGP
jgi:hypothetical protein